MNKRRLHYSLHSLDVLEERQIAKEWVQRVVDYPVLTVVDHADPDLEHALAPIIECEGRVLRVVYNAKVSPLVVVTAYFDRAMRGKL
jgi:hypothetical protein